MSLPQPLRVIAILLGGAAVAMHLRLMRKALRGGMRRALGRSFTLVRIAWGCLALSLAAALAVVLDAPLERLSTLFGLTLVFGWLLSFLLGILQRILPFLASMHLARGSRRPPTPSSLSADRPLAIHYASHLVALAGLALAVVADSAAARGAGGGRGHDRRRRVRRLLRHPAAPDARRRARGQGGQRPLA